MVTLGLGDGHVCAQVVCLCWPSGGQVCGLGWWLWYPWGLLSAYSTNLGSTECWEQVVTLGLGDGHVCAQVVCLCWPSGGQVCGLGWWLWCPWGLLGAYSTNLGSTEC